MTWAISRQPIAALLIWLTVTQLTFQKHEFFLSISQNLPFRQFSAFLLFDYLSVPRTIQGNIINKFKKYSYVLFILDLFN